MRAAELHRPAPPPRGPALLSPPRSSLFSLGTSPSGPASEACHWVLRSPGHPCTRHCRFSELPCAHWKPPGLPSWASLGVKWILRSARPSLLEGFKNWVFQAPPLRLGPAHKTRPATTPLLWPRPSVWTPRQGGAGQPAALPASSRRRPPQCPARAWPPRFRRRPGEDR